MPEKSSFVSRQLKVDSYKPWKYKEENPYLRNKRPEENPYRQPKQENPYLKKKDNVKKERNPYKEVLNDKIDVKIADPILTNPECPEVIGVDRYHLWKIPISKENPYANWKFSNNKDIDPNHEAKCIKTTANFDGHSIRIDAFTVTPKPRGSIEPNDDANEVVKDNLSNLEIEHKNSEESSENEIDNDEGKSGWTYYSVMDDDLSKKKSLNSYDESRIKEAIEIVGKAMVQEPDKSITFDQNINTNTPNPILRDSIRESTKVKEETNMVEKKSPNTNKKVEALQEQLRLLFEHQKLAQPKEIILTDDSKENVQISESKEKKPGKIDQKGSEIGDQSNPIVDKKTSDEEYLNVTKKSDKASPSVREKKTMDGIDTEQPSSEITTSQNKVKEKYSSQLNVKFNGKFEYDHNIITQESKLADNAPTFILVGNRFVREDKALIDLEVNDLTPNNSSNIMKPSQVKLPPELQDIDYEGWYMQQILKEFESNLKTRNNKPKVKPIDSFLEEFDLLL